MMKNKQRAFCENDRKMLICFFLVAFGGLLLLFPYKAFVISNEIDNGALYKHFATLLPAAGVILGLAATEKQQKLPQFMKMYLMVAVLELLCCIGSWIFPNPGWYSIGYNVVYIGSVLVLLGMWRAGAEARKKFGLSWPMEQTKVSCYLIFLFIVLYLGRYFLNLWLSGDFKLWYKTQTDVVVLHEMVSLLNLPISFLIGFLFYFGEEYGWRYFLQPVLQKRFGILGGTLLVGLIWGVWHAPIDWTNEGEICSIILVKTLYCICLGMFFAFTYLVTKNIWVVSIIHFLHNNLPILFFYTAEENIGSVEASISFHNATLFILENLVFAIPLVMYWWYKKYHVTTKQ